MTRLMKLRVLNRPDETKICDSMATHTTARTVPKPRFRKVLRACGVALLIVSSGMFAAGCQSRVTPTSVQNTPSPAAPSGPGGATPPSLVDIVIAGVPTSVAPGASAAYRSQPIA